MNIIKYYIHYHVKFHIFLFSSHALYSMEDEPLNTFDARGAFEYIYVVLIPLVSVGPGTTLVTITTGTTTPGTTTRGTTNH